jgi:hypothetical protein
MAKKKAKKKRVRTTEWRIGQPITPAKEIEKPDDAQNALDIMNHAIGEPLVPPKRPPAKP